MGKELSELEQNRLVELEQAFELFNQTSSQLTTAYETLQHQVADLQQQLAASQQEKYRVGERLEQLLNLLPAGVIVLNAQDEIIEMNPSAENILGYDALGRLWDVVVRNAFLVQNDASELITHDKIVYQLAEAPLNMAQAATSPQMLGKILLIQDVTSARELQDHVNRHQRLDSMGEMAASLAHQIRTPLSSALLYVSQLANHNIDEDKRLVFTDKSLQSLRHLEALVKDMLQYAKGGKSHSQTIELAWLMEKLQLSLEPQLKDQKAVIHFPPHYQKVFISGDFDGLLTAFQNLILNALDMVKGQAEIDITIHYLSNHKVDILVTDNGPGISEDIQEKIFEPFFTSRAKGTGLGLAVVRAVVEAHNGEVWVRSVLGRGATFGLRLPLINTKEVDGNHEDHLEEVELL